VWPALAREGVHIRRGQLSLIAAGPAVGKSAVALTLAVRARVPTLYISADSDATTQYVRMCAMLNSKPAWQVERDLEQGLSVHYDTQLNRLDYIRWCFDANPTPDDITEHVQAHAFATGEFPALVIVDNIKNVWSDQPQETARYAEIVDYLHVLSRQTGAAVVALHHLTGAFDDGIEPAPMSSLLGKISKIPTTILTLYRLLGAYPLAIGVCPVKNRGGKSDPSGGWVIPLSVDLETMTIG